MHAIYRAPTALSPEELDDYLAKGWYRTGQTIFTTNFLYFGKEIFSALWIRLPLQNYTFSKRISKRMRMNLERYRCIVQPASITPEKEYLYMLYRDSFPAPLPPSIKQVLMDNNDFNIYQTYEVLIYDQHQLIGLSYFDLGAESAASILGIYHPDYKKQSIGFFTMLMEIAFCMEQGLKYYYPGYVAPGYTRFDYKLRIGAVEYLNISSDQWVPYSTLSTNDIPIERMKQQLAVLLDLIIPNKSPHQICYYEHFDANLQTLFSANFLDYPIVIYFASNPTIAQYLLIVFDPRTQCYQLLECCYFAQVLTGKEMISYDKPNKRFMFNTIMVVENVLYTHSCPQTFCDYLLKLPPLE